MDAHANTDTPGTALQVTGDGIHELVEIPHLDDATAALVAGNVLFGGMPGSGKSALFNRLAVHAALTGEDGPALVGFDPKKDPMESGWGDADPGR